jgi:hypothetical protein
VFVAEIFTLYETPTLPAASEVLLMAGIPPAETTRLNCFTGPAPAAFDADRLTANVPVVVGVPLITPEVVLMLNPAGNPEAEKLLGLFVAVIVTLYDAFTIAPGNEVLLITGTCCAGPTTRFNCLTGPVPAALDADKLTVKVAAVVGVPLMTPVVGLIVNPGGSPVALKLVGLFVAAMVTL